MGDTADCHIALIGARMFREKELLTFSFATLPFNFETQQRKPISQSRNREFWVHVNELTRFTTWNIGLLAGKDALFGSASVHAPLAIGQLWRSVLNPV